MTIRIKCNSCGASVDAPERLAGQSRPCPNCKLPITVPANELPLIELAAIPAHAVPETDVSGEPDPLALPMRRPPPPIPFAQVERLVVYVICAVVMLVVRCLLVILLGMIVVLVPAQLLFAAAEEVMPANLAIGVVLWIISLAWGLVGSVFYIVRGIRWLASCYP